MNNNLNYLSTKIRMTYKHSTIVNYITIEKILEHRLTGHNGAFNTAMIFPAKDLEETIVSPI